MLIVYVDILLFLNTVVDFIIITATCTLTKIEVKLWRKIVASLLSALFSLYIFLPPFGFWLGLLLRLSSSLTAVLTAFGFKNVRRFLRCTAVFYGVSFIYAGGMAGIWMLFKPAYMSINNGIVYFDVSPLLLITFSFVFYVIITVIKKLTVREADLAERVAVNLTFQRQSVQTTAMLDTGHTLTDSFGNSEIVIIDKATAEVLFGENNTSLMISLEPPEDDLKRYFRLMQIKTVSGESILPAVKINKMKVTYKKKTFNILNPIAVISDGRLGDDYSVVVSPTVLNF